MDEFSDDSRIYIFELIIFQIDDDLNKVKVPLKRILEKIASVLEKETGRGLDPGCRYFQEMLGSINSIIYLKG